MNRIDILQKIVSRKKSCNYLEIGVRNGACFFQIKGAKLKIGVDPAFSFSKKELLVSALRNPSNILRSKYFLMTSDDFFAEKESYLNRKRLDLVFVDGLHTYEQSLRDVQNALRHIRPDGVVVMHDCSPESELSATPAKSGDQVVQRLKGEERWDGYWSGDVWKTIVHLRTDTRLEVFVLNCDFGLGFIRHGKSDGLCVSHEDIERMEYRDLAASRRTLLNLYECDYLEAFLETLG